MTYKKLVSLVVSFISTGAMIMAALPALADTISVDAAATAAVQAATAPTVSVPAPTAEPTSKALVKVNRLPLLQSKGAALIDMRLNSLAALKTKINNSKLTDDQKSSLGSMIDTQVSALTSLKDQIKSGTDIKAVRALVQSIYTDFRIYAVFIPKVHLLMALDAQTNHANGLEAGAFAKYQARIDARKAKGKDVAAWQSALDAARAMVPNIQAKISPSITAVSAFAPADYPDKSKAEINAARADVKSNQKMFITLQQTLRAPFGKK